MTDAGWAALAAMVASLCSVLAAIFGRQAVMQGKKTEEQLLAHEEAAALRSAEIKASLPGPGLPFER